MTYVKYNKPKSQSGSYTFSAVTNGGKKFLKKAFLILQPWFYIKTKKQYILTSEKQSTTTLNKQYHQTHNGGRLFSL